MEMSKKIPPEVLIYVQNVREYFTTNEATKEYFRIENEDDIFFDKLVEVSNKNFKESGEAQLTVDQFEEIRRETKNPKEPIGHFMSIGDLGLIGLN